MTDTGINHVAWTDRKRQVLALMARGKTNAEIAETLGVSLAGAKWHVSEVLSILGVDSREEAAEYWRREHSLRRRISRAAKAFGAPLFAYKTALGATSMSVMVASAVVIGGLSFDSASSSSDLPAELPSPAATPSVEPFALDYVDVLVIDLGNGETSTLAVSTGDYLCTRTRRTSAPSSSIYACWGDRTRFPSSLTLGFGGLPVARPGDGRRALFSGTASLETDHIELDLYGSGSVSVPVVTAPAQLGLKSKFWGIVVDSPDLVGRYRAIAADGSTIEEHRLYDPPGTPPRAQITAPLSDLVQIGSFRNDGSPGTFDPSSSRAGAVARPEGGTYRFRIEHDGTRPLALYLWCQTGVMTLEWHEGPDSSGNGVISADIPPNSAGCFFLVGGGDGAYRISALPN